MVDSLTTVFERVVAQSHTETDLAILRRALIASGEQDVIQNGKYAINITNAQDIRIGDHSYEGPSVESIQQAIRQVLDTISADRFYHTLQDYFRALRAYCMEFPYISLDNLQSDTGHSLDDVYIPLFARLLSDQSNKELPIADILRRSIEGEDPKNLLIIGEPGAGKSALLRHIIKCAWDSPSIIGLSQPYLAMAIRLRSLALSEGISVETRLINALSKASELVLNEDPPSGFFTEWPQRMNTHWLLLLDGIDEIPTEKFAISLRWIKDLIRMAKARGHHVIITSRPIEKLITNLRQDLLSLELLPLTVPQQREFAQRWHHQRADLFLQELSAVKLSESITATPLLLTIAATVFEKDGYLTKSRTELYERFVDIWIEEAKDRGMQQEIMHIDATDVVRQVIEYIALHSKEHDISFSELKQIVIDYLSKELKFPESKADISSIQIIDILNRHSGIILHRNLEYMFIHPTFQHYLAACSAIRTGKGNLDRIWEISVSNWQYQDPNISEFIFNLLNRITDDTTPLVERLLSENSVDPHWQTPLFIAARACLDEVKMDNDVRRKIINNLFFIASERELIELTRVSASFALVTLSYFKDDKYVISKFVDLIDNNNASDWLRVQAATILKRIDRVMSVKYLSKLARNERINPWAKYMVIARLTEMKEADALMVIIHNSSVLPEVRIDAIEALAQLGYQEEMRTFLLNFIRQLFVPGVRVNAARVLAKLDLKEVATNILRDITKDIDIQVRCAAYRVLADIGHFDDDMILDMLNLGKESELIAGSRSTIAEILAKVGKIEEAKNMLILDGNIPAARILVKLGYIDEASLIFMNRINDTMAAKWEIHEAAETLAKLKRFNDLHALIEEESINIEARLSAIAVLTEAETSLPFLERITRVSSNDTIIRAVQHAIIRLRRVSY